MNLAVVNSVRKVGKKIPPKSEWCNDVVIAAVEREEAAWKDVLGTKDEN